MGGFGPSYITKKNYMATTNIELDIENITGVTDANDQFIISAQKSLVASIPKNLLKWAQTASSASTDGSAISFTKNDLIIAVERNGYNCKEIPMSDSKWALDSSSLKYATAMHPVWYHKQGSVHFAPVTDGSNAGYIFYIDSSKIDDDCDLRSAVIYRATSMEFAKLASSEITTWSSDLFAPPLPNTPSFTSPSIDTTTMDITVLNNLGTPPSYTPPTVAGATEELTATISDGAVGTDADWQDFSDWFEVLGQMIEDDEDIELANAQLQKISTYVNTYQSAMQNKLNLFNKENAEYQAKLQEAIQQAQLSVQKSQQDAQLAANEKQQETSLLLQKENQEYLATLQHFSADVSKYAAEVNEEQAKISSKTANAAFYGQESKKYYDWSVLEINSYIQNNEKSIRSAMVSQQVSQR